MFHTNKKTTLVLCCILQVILHVSIWDWSSQWLEKSKFSQVEVFQNVFGKTSSLGMIMVIKNMFNGLRGYSNNTVQIIAH